MVFIVNVNHVLGGSKRFSMFEVENTSEVSIQNRFEVSTSPLRRVVLMEFFIAMSSPEKFVFVGDLSRIMKSLSVGHFSI